MIPPRILRLNVIIENTDSGAEITRIQIQYRGKWETFAYKHDNQKVGFSPEFVVSQERNKAMPANVLCQLNWDETALLEVYGIWFHTIPNLDWLPINENFDAGIRKGTNLIQRLVVCDNFNFYSKQKSPFSVPKTKYKLYLEFFYNTFLVWNFNKDNLKDQIIINVSLWSSKNAFVTPNKFSCYCQALSDDRVKMYAYSPDAYYKLLIGLREEIVYILSEQEVEDPLITSRAQAALYRVRDGL